MADNLLNPEALLGELAWLRALARRLCDEHAADDACQATLLAALERRPEPGPSLRPWLTRVLRNLSLRLRRDDARRRRREDAVRRPDREPSTDEVVVRASAQRAVVEAVMELAEPYRTTVLLRFFEDLPARRVAERMAVPVDTVHTRLRRAMALLRERMDRGHGQRAAWAAPLGAWCGAGVPAASVGAAVLAAPLGVLLMTIKTKLVIATAALLAVTAAFFAFGPDRSTQANGEPVTVADGSGLHARLPAKEVVSDTSPAMARVDAVLEASVEPGPQGFVEVRIVHQATHEPAGGAEVLFAPLATYNRVMAEERRAGRDQQGDQEALLRRAFKRTVADGAGTARLPAWAYLFVVARAGTEYGDLGVSAGNRPEDGWQLELQPDVTVWVQTVDREGHAVPDVPIALEYERVRTPVHALPVGRTRGPDALLAIRHLQRRLGAESWMVTTHIAGASQARAAVDRRALPSGPLRLVVPPTGRLMVQFVHPRGAQPPGDGNVEMTALDAPLPDGSVGAWSMQDEREVGTDGRVLFEHVAVGSRLKVYGRLCLQSFQQIVAGPKARGEEVLVTFTLSDGAPVLCGRALDAQGMPLAHRTFAAEIDTEQETRSNQTFRSDEQGRFRWHLDPGLAGRKVVRLRLCSSASEEDESTWAVVEAVQITGGEQPLGEITFAPGPLLVAGQVCLVDRPAPVDSLALQVQCLPPQPELPEGMRRGEIWRSCTLQAQWSAGAHFTVRGHVPAQRTRLVVKCSGMLPAIVEFTTGTEDLHVALEPRAGLRVRLAHGSAIQLSMFVLRLDPAEGDANHLPRQTLPWEDPLPGSSLPTQRLLATGLVEFAWERQAGRYRLTLSTPAEDQPTWQREVTLVAGQVQAFDLDLPPELRLVTLRVVNEAGAPIPDDRAAVVVERSDGEPWFGMPIDNGMATLLLGQPSCKVVVLAPHCAALRAVVTGDTTLTVRPAVPVHVRLATMPGLPPDVSLRISLYAEPAGIWRSPFRLANGSGGASLLTGLQRECGIEADGTFRGEAPVPGRYRVTAVLAREGARPSGMLLQPATFAIAEDERSKEVVVTVPDAALAEALSELAR